MYAKICDTCKEVNANCKCSAAVESDCSTLAGKWSLSTNGENYHHQFDTRDEAIGEGNSYGGTFYIGQCVSPTPPEDLFDGWSVESWLENSVWEHDDYAGEWAEDAVHPTSTQRDDLAEQIRPVIAAWLDRHNLRPKFWNIDPASVEQIDSVDE